MICGGQRKPGSTSISIHFRQTYTQALGLRRQIVPTRASASIGHRRQYNYLPISLYIGLFCVSLELFAPVTQCHDHINCQFIRVYAVNVVLTTELNFLISSIHDAHRINLFLTEMLSSTAFAR